MHFNPRVHKNIIFDLGGVLLNIDYLLTVRSFQELGIKNFDQLFSQANQNQLFDLYDKGVLSSNQFRDEIRNLSGLQLTDVQIDNAWNAILLDFPKQRLELLYKLKKSYPIYLLSNTSDIHMIQFKKYMNQTFGITNFFGLFEKAYLSYEIGMRKPDSEIFEFVLTQNNLIPNQTFYIDDSIQHIEAASKLGIDAYWLDIKKESVLDLFI